MRRGLKQTDGYIVARRDASGFKPIPDEEGTETEPVNVSMGCGAQSFKPIPDEEGTETNGTTHGNGVTGTLQTDPR